MTWNRDRQIVSLNRDDSARPVSSLVMSRVSCRFQSWHRRQLGIAQLQMATEPRLRNPSLYTSMCKNMDPGARYTRP